MTTEPLTQPLFTTQFGRLRLAETINQVTGAIGFLSYGVSALDLGGVSGSAPLAASTTYYLNAQSGATAGQIAVNKAADYPRNLEITASTTNANQVVVTGLDANGYVITETLTLNNTSTVLGIKAFSYVLYVTIPSFSGTFSLGLGVKFGFSNRVQVATVFIADVDGVADSNLGTTVLAATTAGADYYGTWSPATAPNGTHKFFAAYLPTDYQNAGVNN